MVEILVKAHGTQNWVKGFPVVAKQNWTWGKSEGLPDFVKIRITDADSESQITTYVKQWIRKTSYEILEHDADTDSFRVRIFADTKKHQVNVAEMEAFLLSWGAEKLTDDNGVVFEITAMDALNKTGFLDFGEEEEYIDFTEIDYIPETGVHKIKMDYSGSSFKTKKEAEAKLLEKHCTIISDDLDKGEIIFEVNRTTMIGYLEKGVREKFDIMLGRSQYFFPESTVDTAIANGGILEMTINQMEEVIEDMRV